jgi:ribosomal protein S18 acetylase RimI-like enzyme
MSADVVFRHPIEADHAVLEPLLRDWFGGSRALAASVQRLWFRHFSSTSWIAETPDGRVAGFLVGFVSPDRPAEAVVVAVATSPNRRRRGIGRALIGRFEGSCLPLGAGRVVTAVPPDERVAIEFLRAIGFTPTEDAATKRLFGIPSVPDYDGHGQDRAVFVREIGATP